MDNELLTLYQIPMDNKHIMSKMTPIQSDCSIVEQIGLYYKQFESFPVTNLENIQVLEEEIFKNKNSFNIKTLSPIYPSLWFCPIPLSPFANSMEEETIEWMKKLGLIPNKQVEHNIRRMEPHHYAGYSLPLANFDYAIAFCKFITLWLLFDDIEVEVANDPEIMMSRFDSVAGKSMDTNYSLNPFAIGFKELGDEFERLGASRQWRERFDDGLKKWAKVAVQEAIIRTSTLDQTFQELLDMRSVTIGIQPTMVMLERTMGIELTDEILKDPLYGKCVDMASIICCTVNDLVGLGKDLIQNQTETNLVLFHFRLFGGTLEDSYQAIIDIHNKAVEDFDLYATELLQRVSDVWQERLHWFFMLSRFMSTGYSKWHQDCTRYLRCVATEGNNAFKIRIKSR